MKTPHLYFVATLLLCAAIYAFGRAPQSTSAIVQFNQPMAVQSSLAACTWPAGVATTGMMAVCPVNLPSGTFLATSYQGGPFTVPTAAAAGVTSFNGRTGAVTLTDADVTGTGLKVSTTVTSTAVSTPQ